MRGLKLSVPRRDEEGAVAITVAIMLIAFVAIVAMAVDSGGLYLRRRELVNGSDSAALAAARTCARGGLDEFGTPEEAADFHVRQNGLITSSEVSGGNITSMSNCPARPLRGHVSVEYTSQQSVFFAPALGFNGESPVTTEATASWGIGSNNPVPFVISDQGAINCPIPPAAWPTEGQQCAFWYDNDRYVTGNFGFLSLNPQGWDVPIGDNCSGAQSGGTDNIANWINGTLAANVALNWTDPTYVCNDTGLRGAGNDTKGRPWVELKRLIGETRDFPINYIGQGRPVPSAPVQGTVFKDTGNQGTLDSIDKFDIIGFAFLEIVDVVTANDAQGGTGLCTTKNGSPVTWTTAGQTLDLTTISSGSNGWQGCPGRNPDDVWNVVVTQAKTNDPACCIFSATCPPAAGTDYCYDAPTRTITWNGPVPKDTKISFNWEIDPNNGPCGPIPSNSSAMCVVTVWHGSTLDSDFVPTDKNQVIRLCDYDYGTCLDQ
jgi:hypothetical protein